MRRFPSQQGDFLSRPDAEGALSLEAGRSDAKFMIFYCPGIHPSDPNQHLLYRLGEWLGLVHATQRSRNRDLAGMVPPPGPDSVVAVRGPDPHQIEVRSGVDFCDRHPFWRVMPDPRSVVCRSSLNPSFLSKFRECYPVSKVSVGVPTAFDAHMPSSHGSSKE